MRRHPHSFPSNLFLIAVLLVAVSSKNANAADQSTKPAACNTNAADTGALAVDDTTDVHAVTEYRLAVAAMLQRDEFATLDCIANSSRETKATFAGGMWKIHVLYTGLSQPQLHATEEDWTAQFARLNRWIAAKPDSITPRIALAKAHIIYGWYARGGETSDTVSDSGWRIFGERVAKAQLVLDDAAKLPVKDPEWFVVQQEIAQDQGWEKPEAAKVTKLAAAFEPGYQYYYRMYTTYLLPKWHGEEGEAEKYAETAANQIGGDNGDITYFQIAVDQICHCGDDEVALKHMSWPRIQKGFAALEKRSGASLYNMNQMAFMATVFNDLLFADKQFQRLGDRWSDEVWHIETYYQQCKKSASEIAPVLARNQATMDEAEANLQTPEGVRYHAEVQRAMDIMLKECAEVDISNLDKFTMTLRIGTNGSLERMSVNPTTHIFNCVIKKLWEAEQAKKPRLPQAPKPSFWVKVDLDPQAVISAQGK